MLMCESTDSIIYDPIACGMTSHLQPLHLSATTTEDAACVGWVLDPGVKRFLTSVLWLQR